HRARRDAQPSVGSPGGQDERCVPGSSNGEPSRPFCESYGADTCAIRTAAHKKKIPKVVTTRANQLRAPPNPLIRLARPRTKWQKASRTAQVGLIQQPWLRFHVPLIE